MALPPETPWFIVVGVGVFLTVMALLQKVMDGKLAQQKLEFEERLTRLKNDGAADASAAKSIENLVGALTEFSQLIGQRDKQELEERQLFRDTISKNNQAVGGLELAVRSMGTLIENLKGSIDRWPIDFQTIMRELLLEIIVTDAIRNGLPVTKATTGEMPAVTTTTVTTTQAPTHEGD